MTLTIIKHNKAKALLEKIISLPPKLLNEDKELLLSWKSQYPESNSRKLPMMLVHYHLENLQLPLPSFTLSEFSVRRVLQECNYVWEMGRLSRAVVFTAATAVASARYAHSFRRLMGLHDVSENFKRVLYAYETTFYIRKVPAMILSKRELPSRYKGTTGRNFFTLIKNVSGDIARVHGNIG